MNLTDLYSELAKAVPVLLGGLVAIAGGFGSQLLIHDLTDRRDRIRLRRERLEALVKSVYAHDQWIDAKRRTMIFRNEDHDDPSPLDEARMIQALHFPELAREVLAIQTAQVPLIKFIHAERLKHMKDKEDFIQSWDSSPYNEAYSAYLDAVANLTNKCRSLLSSG